MSGAPEIRMADCSENTYYASSDRSEGARMQAKAHLKLVTPTGKKRAVAPQRRPNSEYRKREHLTPAEVAKLIEAARGNRYGQRDATMILVAYRHGSKPALRDRQRSRWRSASATSGDIHLGSWLAWAIRHRHGTCELERGLLPRA